MEYRIGQQESYNRVEAVLRFFLGPIYVGIPHALILLPLLLLAGLGFFYTGFYILLKGTYPEAVFKFNGKLMNRLAALHLSVYHMRDGYPSLTGPYDESGPVYSEIPGTINRLSVLIRFVFVLPIVLPHLVVVLMKALLSGLLTIPAFVAVMTSGRYPEGLYAFQENYLKHAMDVLGYCLFITQLYPSFRLSA